MQIKIKFYVKRGEIEMKYFYPVPENLEILRKLYKKLCFEHHPDVGGSEEAMKTINQEYTELFHKIKSVCFDDTYEKYSKFENNITGCKIIKCLFTATRETDRTKLYLLKYDNKSCQWVICWNYDQQTQNWNLGTYCRDFKRALSEFRRKCTEYKFNDIVENYR